MGVTNHRKDAMKQWKAFISHASEDKDKFVRELYQKLSRFGLKIWYDEFTLKVGDSLSRSIDNGLKESDFGIVVLSKNFLSKDWTDYEYRSLISKEVNNKPAILPVWLDISKDEVANYSLYLADKFAIAANSDNIDEVVLKLIEVLEPNLYKNISRFLYYQQLIKNASFQKVKREELKVSKIRHDKLSKSLTIRSEILHELIFKPFFGHEDLNETLDGFKRDLYPEREIKVWEAILSVYLIYSQTHNITEYVILKDIITHLTYFSTGNVYDRAYLETNELLELMNMLRDRLKE